MFSGSTGCVGGAVAVGLGLAWVAVASSRFQDSREIKIARSSRQAMPANAMMVTRMLFFQTLWMDEISGVEVGSVSGC